MLFVNYFHNNRFGQFYLENTNYQNLNNQLYNQQGLKFQMAQQQKVSLDSLPPQQILQIKQQFQQDIKLLNQSLAQLKFAYERYQQSKNTIKSAQKITASDEILIPLSNSLYIPGHMDNQRDGKKYYLVEYGTGYFVQRQTKEATDFCERKSKMVKQKIEKLVGVINEKKVMLQKCNMTLMALMNKAQQQKQ